MAEKLVNLNVNPCKMCMPMGAVSAFCGIRGCMTILHGSQGCSTYIRRHMATHYNEPVDIASSSLTEEGTVFGGEKNLVKGIENLIRLYDPAVIGVATTCLAETIGEDVPGIVQRFRESHPEVKARIVTVASAGYSGTQYEGFFRALRAMAEQTEMSGAKNAKINVVTGLISPADTRYLKELLERMGLKAVLLPDLSENLDGRHLEVYNRLPAGGTSLAEIEQMAGARATVELASFVDEKYSPGEYLKQTYGVPLFRLNLPVGLRDTDALVETLKKLGGRVFPELRKQRGRYLDAMVDSHKYNAQVRAALFGEPDFVYAVSRLCVENGIYPVVSATGSACPGFREVLLPELRKAAEYHLEDTFVISDRCDFDGIERYVRRWDANMLIGSSDGRRIEEKLKIPLIRCAFPIHDHVGGQRIRMLGYEGGMTLLDRVTNAMLSRTEGSFREELYRRYYPGTGMGDGADHAEACVSARAVNLKKSRTHPCFNGYGGVYARVHLPVAPECNIQCGYCLRRFDCPNESRPGVTSEVLLPQEALERYRKLKDEMPHLEVVGIAGPGDALANFDNTWQTLSLIRQEDAEVAFCLSTNGLMLPLYAHRLAQLEVSHVTVTVNAVDTEIGARVYRRVDYMGQRYEGRDAAAILMANQFAGIRAVKELGMVCKVNVVMLKGVNDGHIPQIVEKVKALGCDLTNIMRMIPVKGSHMDDMEPASCQEVTDMRTRCGKILPQMRHCAQCRADAAGVLGADMPDAQHKLEGGRRYV